MYAIRSYYDKWIINGEYEYDLIINTSPLNELADMLQHVPSEIKNAFSKLKYNKVSTMLWKTSQPLENTWTYIPSSDIKIHRIINIGNFFP